MTRISEKFKELKKRKKKALVSFISAGDPSINVSQKILEILPASGVDIIELGIPFSDPMADGPIIQRSSQRSIHSGFTTQKAFDMVKFFRKNDDKTPIIFMGYFNPIFQFGLKKFFNEASKVGVDGIIIVDLPPEEEEILDPYIEKKNIDIIRLITPTTNNKRLNTILKKSGGFLYYVSIMGITGTKVPPLEKVKNSVEKIKLKNNLPVVVGFGIKTKEQVSSISKFADGSVIGSSLVKIIEDSINSGNKKSLYINIKSFLRKLELSCYYK